MSKQKLSRLWPAMVASILFIGSVAANQISGPVAEFMQSNQVWVWILISLALVVAGFEAIRINRPSSITPLDINAVDKHYSLRHRYLQRITDRFQYLPLRAIDSKSANAETEERERLHLTDVYINLNTTSRTAKDELTTEISAEISNSETRLLTAFEATLLQQRVVLLGDPGSGKSTFVNHLSYCLAKDILDPRNNWLQHLNGWPPEKTGLLPLPITLRELAAWFIQTQCPDRKAGLFQGYLSYWLKQLNLIEFEPILVDRLNMGDVIILLDGMDEVPSVDDVLFRVKEMIDDLPSAYPSTQMIVTCRVLSYQDVRWRLDSKRWSSYELAKLDKEQITSFISAWYNQLAYMKIVTHADQLSSQLVHALRRHDLWRLAQNPLLLTVMALVHTNKGELPDARVLLYEDVVDLLLWRWEAIKLEDGSDQETNWRQLLRTAGLNDIDLKQALWELAFDIHGKSQASASNAEVTADVSKAELLERLRILHPENSLDWAENLVHIIEKRSGLLVENRPGIYSFPHRTFQEYLAGCYLSVQPDFTDRAKTLAEQDVFWWQAIVLAVGRLVHAGNIDPPLLLVDELSLVETPSHDDAMSWRNVWLAGQCLTEIGLHRAKRRHLGNILTEKIRDQLTTLISNDLLEARERAEAATVLSVIGDKRNFDEMVYIPGGPFEMGSSEEEVAAAYEQLLVDYGLDHYSERATHARIQSVISEKPRHEVHVDPFFISKYPVTNMQYAKFVAEMDYHAPLHWVDSVPPSELKNHPVVNVSWNDACEYCHWLTAKYGRAFRLPTEAEWEKAARGTDRRLYPWGEKLDPTVCNSGDTGINDTSSVGIFLAGASPYMCLDMVGNVWEWTLNLWGKDRDKAEFNYPYDPNDGREIEERINDSRRVLRGGCFYNYAGRLRCAYRSGSHYPGDRENNNGFRVVLPATDSEETLPLSMFADNSNGEI